MNRKRKNSSLISLSKENVDEGTDFTEKEIKPGKLQQSSSSSIETNDIIKSPKVLPADGDVLDFETSWKDLGLHEKLLETLEVLQYKHPSKIQKEVIPVALSGKDVIGIAQTGSGKTAAFIIPILHGLLQMTTVSPCSALVISPTRELSLQIKEHFEAFGSRIGLRTALLVGGENSKFEQQKILQVLKPHIVIGTPGRISDHLQTTKGFDLRRTKYLVLDEADKLLSSEYEKDLEVIFSQINMKDRRTFLFSATMTKKVEKLEKAHLTDPVKVQITNSKYATVATIQQEYLFIPEKFKEVYLCYLLNENAGKRIIVFTGQSSTVLVLSILTRSLGFPAVPLSGQMEDHDRTHCLRKFKAGERPILISTDVSGRGLDLPQVDLVINYDIPVHSKEYIHRIGRTGRIGKDGRSITMVTQYDVEYFQKLEELIGKKMETCPSNKEDAMTLVNTVSQALDLAKKRVKEKLVNMKSNGGGGGDEEEVIDSAIRLLAKKQRFSKQNCQSQAASS